MPKLENVTIGVSPLTEQVFIGVPKKPGEWKEKVESTSDFIAALLIWCPPGWKREVTSSEGKRFTITVKEVTDKEASDA